MKILERKRVKNELSNELHLSFLKFRSFSFIQSSFGWDDDPGFYYFQISAGDRYFLDLLLCAGKASFSLSVLGRNWYLHQIN